MALSKAADSNIAQKEADLKKLRHGQPQTRLRLAARNSSDFFVGKNLKIRDHSSFEKNHFLG